LSRGHVAEAWRDVTGGLAAAEVLTIIPQSGHFIFIFAIFPLDLASLFFAIVTRAGRSHAQRRWEFRGKADRSFGHAGHIPGRQPAIDVFF
jgi:hypothetical protein